jgi:DNA-binding GntR family transcriptional regulator
MVVQHRQIAEDLRRQIAASVYPPGSCLPPGGLILRLRRAPATPEQAAALRVPSGEEVLHVLRLRTLDGEPILVERIVYAAWVADAVAGLPRDTVSLTEGLAEETGVTYGHGRHVVEAIGARVLEASLLGIRRGSPMLRHRYVISTAEGRAFVTSDDRYKPGTMSITVDNAVPARSIARANRGLEPRVRSGRG